MKKMRFALSLMALTLALCFASHPTLAQSASELCAQSDRSTTANANRRSDCGCEYGLRERSCKLVDNLVLTATDSTTTYQLDDQQKARGFLNKSVKVTGVLDASTGTIRVRAIDPV